MFALFHFKLKHKYHDSSHKIIQKDVFALFISNPSIKIMIFPITMNFSYLRKQYKCEYCCGKHLSFLVLLAKIMRKNELIPFYRMMYQQKPVKLRKAIAHILTTISIETL